MDGYGKRILLAGEDQQILDVITLVLDGEGYSVYLAIRVEDVLRQMMKRRFDAVVVEGDMLGKGGLGVRSFCRIVHPGLPVVLMLATSGLWSAEQLGLEAAAVLKKPFETEELLQVLRTVCHDNTVPAPECLEA